MSERANPSSAFAFGATQAIRSGLWDQYLDVIAAAIRYRKIELSRAERKAQ
jgi:hypothetical protein